MLKNRRMRLGALAALCALALAVIVVSGYGRTAQNLTIRVTDGEGNPLPGAMVGLSENGETLLADGQGRVTWKALEAEQATLVVAAQGYVLRTTVIPLESGANQATLALEKKSHAVPYQPPTSP